MVVQVAAGAAARTAATTASQGAKATARTAGKAGKATAKAGARAGKGGARAAGKTGARATKHGARARKLGKPRRLSSRVASGVKGGAQDAASKVGPKANDAAKKAGKSGADAGKSVADAGKQPSKAAKAGRKAAKKGADQARKAPSRAIDGSQRGGQASTAGASRGINTAKQHSGGQGGQASTDLLGTGGDKSATAAAGAGLHATGRAARITVRTVRRHWLLTLIIVVVILLMSVVTAFADDTLSQEAIDELNQEAALAALSDCGGGDGGGGGGSGTLAGNLPEDMDLDRALAALRQIESGNYKEPPNRDGASGAYQFLPGRWREHTDSSYSEAYLAPPSVQDAAAVSNITSILAAAPEDMHWSTAIGAGWLGGEGALTNLDGSEDSNGTTPRDHAESFQAAYENPSDESQEGGNGSLVISGSGCSGSGGSSNGVVGGYTLPIDMTLYEEQGRKLVNGVPDSTRGSGDWFAKPHHDYPAADIPIGSGTPVYAAVAGEVVATSSEPDRCGIGLTIEDAAGVEYTYCHAQSLKVSGGEVEAGQEIMSSGNTGNSSGPHLHFGIRVDGQSRCPQKFLLGIYDGTPVDPKSLPSSGCTYIP